MASTGFSETCGCAIAGAAAPAMIRTVPYAASWFSMHASYYGEVDPQSGLPGGLMRRSLVLGIALVCSGAAIYAQNNRIDTVAPSAPELAAYGPLAIGVRTIQVTDTKRPDILNTKEGGPTARYDRTLTLEVWYPAVLAAGQKPGGEYKVITLDPATTATLYGQAVRDAAPRLRQRFGDGGSGGLETAATPAGGYPLVIISHGYPGNRFLMSHIGENLASKGFVVVSIDHKDSTYDDQKAFGSTLYNRAFDQLFVLNAIERLNR